VPPRRTRAPTRPIKIELDGDEIVADADASLASALAGAGDLLLARSPKFHRPRGPSCMRGGCDGCLMRVDGAPNVMTCMRRATDGTRVERQNVILTAKVDILRAADWFFPKGMNHHEMFAGVPGIQQVMQAFARRVSGLGELPDAPPDPAPPMRTLEADVLVVGGGAYGMSAASALRRAGLTVALVDDGLALGGALLSFPPGEIDKTIMRLRDALDGVDVHLEATVLGVLEGDDWMVASASGMTRVRARAHVVATGAHDPTPLFEGNDLPGVMSARAAGRMLREGVLCGEEILLDGEGPYARAFASAAREHGARVEQVSGVTSVRGLSRVRSAVAAGKSFDCDAVVFEGAPAPSFELAVQAGAEVRHLPNGYSVRTDDHGRASRNLYAIGEITSAPLEAASWERAAATVANAIRSAL
jgi:sarcosine oxidase, subunit alpha